MERRKWFCETHQMWFNESCELCERSSPESGGRRQEAENDHGSEWSSEYHATEICTMFGHGHFDKVVEYLDKLRNEVSARSADAYEVLGMAISQTREIIIGIDEQLNSEDGGSVYDDDMLEDLRGAYASSISHFRRAQNLLKKPGPG